MGTSLVVIVLLVNALYCCLCSAAPQLLARPLYVSNSATNLLRRTTSSDPSCPPGWLCNAQGCPSGVICPGGYKCIDFEGSAFCAPDLSSQGSYCSLNPDTMQGIACTGVCCHGQCYESGVICCSADISCSLDVACNVCPLGQSCSGDGSCSGDTTSSTTTKKTTTSITTSSIPITSTTGIVVPPPPPPPPTTTTTTSLEIPPPPPIATPTVVSSDDTFNSIGCYSDDINSRALENGTLVASNMTVDVCVQFAIEDGWQYAGVEFSDECYVGNDLLASAIPESSGCDMACAGDPTEICGGGDRIEVYQDTTWIAPTIDNMIAALDTWLAALDAYQTALNDWYTLLLQYTQQEATAGSTRKREFGPVITLAEIAAKRSTAVGFGRSLIRAGSVLTRRLKNGFLAGGSTPPVDAEEIMEMRPLLDQTESLVSDTESRTQNATPDESVQTVSNTVWGIGAPGVALTGTAGATVIGATSFGIYKLFEGLKDLFDPDSGKGSGPGTPVTPTLPDPTPTTTTTTSASPIPTMTTNYIMLFTDDMTGAQYILLTAWIYLTGGSVDEFIFDDSVKWYSFSVELNDFQALLLANAYPLLDSIFFNVDVTLVDEDDTPITGPPTTAPAATPAAAARRSSAKQAEHCKLETAENNHNGTAKMKRTPMNNVMITQANGWPVNFGINFWPFHLQWLSNLWAKNNLMGSYIDVPWYVWDSTVPSTFVYVLDSGLLRSHQEFANAQITEGYDYTVVPTGNISSMTDSTGHGTAMAAMIVGTTLGVNPRALVIPVKIKTAGNDEVRLKAVIRAIPGIIETHRRKGNPLAIASLSIGISAAGLSNNNILALLPTTKTDPFPRLIRRFNQANIIVINSAPNLVDDDDAATKTQSQTPQKWGGAGTQLIMIGSCDANGIPSDFVPQDPQNMGYITAWTIGELVFSPTSTPGGTSYKIKFGSSAATAMTAGLMSIFVGQGIVSSTATAKNQMVAEAVSRKGDQTSWPIDAVRPFAPRMASNIEVDCTNPAVNPNSYVATQYSFIDGTDTINDYALGNFLTYQQYTAAYPAFTTCRSVVPGPTVNPMQG